MAALFCGVSLLAGGGHLYSAADRNPMASPEVLRISSGAAFGVVFCCFWCRVMPLAGCYPAGSLGAAATLLVIMIAAGRGGFSHAACYLAGMALKYRVHHAFDDVAGKW